MHPAQGAEAARSTALRSRDLSALWAEQSVPGGDEREFDTVVDHQLPTANVRWEGKRVLLESLVRDLRFGWRTLWRSPGFTLVAVLTLALGVGASAAILSLTWSILFRTLPFEEPERVIPVWQSDHEDLDQHPFSFPAFRDLKERNRVFQFLAMYRPENQNLIDGDGEPEQLEALLVSSEFLDALGIEPLQGRGFGSDDDQPGASPAVMMSYELWQRRFGGDEGVLGKTIRLEDKILTVIGIFPKGVRSEILWPGPLGDLWLPMGLFYDRLEVNRRELRPNLYGVGRLAEGVSLARAEEDLGRVSNELAAEFPETDGERPFRGKPLREFQLGDDPATFQLLVAMVLLVLLIACINLANLMLSRYANREQELRNRFAMGAGRFQIMRLLMTENFLLALCSGVVGGLLALAIMRVLPNWLASVVQTVENAESFGPILLIAVPLSVVAGLLVGCAPAWRATRTAEKTGGSWGRSFARGLHLRRVLIVVELALATVTMVAAGLMLGSLEKLLDEDLGFRDRQALALDVLIPQAEFLDASGWTQFFDEAATEVAALPGVEDVVIASHFLVGGLPTSPVAAADRLNREDFSRTHYQTVSPNYFQVLGIPLLEGRGFHKTDDDRLGSERVVIISRSLARRYWPENEAVGKELAFEFDGTMEDFIPFKRRIVGIVEDVRVKGPREESLPTVYTPYSQRPFWLKRTLAITVVLTTTDDPNNLSAHVRELFAEIAPQNPVTNIETLSSKIATQVDEETDLSWLLSLFGLLALTLAVVGVFGLVSLTVASRLREICVRMALGARRFQVVWSLLQQTLLTALLGTALGSLVAAKILGKFMEKHLFGLEVVDLRTYLVSASLLLGVAFLATLIPSWRASEANPSEVLRYE